VRTAAVVRLALRRNRVTSRMHSERVIPASRAGGAWRLVSVGSASCFGYREGGRSSLRESAQ